MTELAIQMEQGKFNVDDEVELEQQKAEAIAKCQRRIEAARLLFEDGDLTREEYLKRKESNEREMAHWQSRTTETKKAAIELAMCMETIDNLVRYWDGASNEDKQSLARMLFDYIVYDLNRKCIVNLQLKTW